MKKILILLLVLMAITAAVQADDLSDVMQNGVLRMGSAPEYAPFVFYGENDAMTGIDIALVEEVGRRMGVKVQTVDIAFDGLIDSMSSAGGCQRLQNDWSRSIFPVSTIRETQY